LKPTLPALDQPIIALQIDGDDGVVKSGKDVRDAVNVLALALMIFGFSTSSGFSERFSFGAREPARRRALPFRFRCFLRRLGGTSTAAVWRVFTGGHRCWRLIQLPLLSAPLFGRLLFV
jgi:hypothetical protein